MYDPKMTLTRWVDAKIKAYKDAKARFDKQCETNPHYALEWSMALFEATAGWKLAMELKMSMEGGVSAQLLIDNLPGRLSNQAHLTSFSTSPVANLMKTLELKVLGELIEDSRWWKGA